MTSHPFPPPVRVLRSEKERRLRQRGHVIWLYGLSGSGKSTLTTTLEYQLAAEGFATLLLDGDEVRAGLNRGLGFSDADRTENLRRVAEVARLAAQAGLVTLCAFITPQRNHRAMLRDIIGRGDFSDIHLAATFATCARRDPKGLYARAAARNLPQFTGLDSSFEPPAPGEASLVIDTETMSLDQSLALLHAHVRPLVSLPDAWL